MASDIEFTFSLLSVIFFFPAIRILVSLAFADVITPIAAPVSNTKSVSTPFICPLKTNNDDEVVKGIVSILTD